MPWQNTGGRSAHSFQVFLHTAGDNTAVGYHALAENSTGQHVTALGHKALSSNTTGIRNTAIGAYALQQNTENSANTAVGAYALAMNSVGSGDGYLEATMNTAIGDQALRFNISGAYNTAVGANTLLNVETVSGNTAVGTWALTETALGGNTAIGTGALETVRYGTRNIALGYFAGVALNSDHPDAVRSYNIFIGHAGESNDDRTIRIGTTQQTRTFISGILEGPIPPLPGLSTHVCILANDQVVPCEPPDSSRALKEQIVPIGEQSSAVEPVTFRFKPQYAAGREGRQFGLIAEEVAETFPDLAHYRDGRPVGVHYDRLIPLLLNEVQRLHRTVARQQEQIERLRQGG